jgi:hypothetical protein
MKTPLFIETGIPHWLQPEKRDSNPPFAERTWEDILNWCRAGHTLTAFCREIDGAPEIGQLRKWIHDDEERLEEYYRAQAIGAAQTEDEIRDIADGKSHEGVVPNDVKRDSLRINARKFLLGVWNRDRYGERKQAEVSVSIDMHEVIDEGRARVESSRRPALIIDGQVVDES